MPVAQINLRRTLTAQHHGHLLAVGTEACALIRAPETYKCLVAATRDIEQENIRETGLIKTRVDNLRAVGRPSRHERQRFIVGNLLRLTEK